MLRSIISWLSHQDSERASAEYRHVGHADDSTKEDDVNAKLVEFLRQPRPVGLHPIIRIINDDLPSSIEEPLDGIFACVRNLPPKFDRLIALRPWVEKSSKRLPEGRHQLKRTQSEVITGEFSCTTQDLPSVISEGYNHNLNTRPSEITLQSPGDMSLPSGGQADGQD